MTLTGRYSHSDLLSHGCVATIGFFDGVHKGHRFLVEQVKDKASLCALPSVAITFANHPASVLRPDFHPLLLTSSDEKSRLLLDAGVDVVAMLDFTLELSRMSAREFMQNVLKRELNVKTLLIGYDHRFGHGGGETFEDYLLYGHEMGIEVVKCEELVFEPESDAEAQPSAMKCSSSEVRRFLSEGYVDRANIILGRNYSIEGEVVGGFRVGRRIGYPTANVNVGDAYKLVPARGVYAVRLSFPDSDQEARYGGMMNIGYRPTLNNGSEQSIEVHLFDFSANIYSERVRIEFVARIRSERRFDSVEQLREQLAADETACRELLK